MAELILDIGQTGMRGVVRSPDSTEQTIHGPPVSRAIVNSAELDQLSEQVCAVSEGLGPFSSVGIGLSGLAEDEDGYLSGSQIAQQLRSSLDAERLVLASDVVTGYLGSLRQGSGVVLTWGTGSVAIASDGNSAWKRADGRGPTLGDLGGGYWIGQQGLIAALDHLDGRGGSLALSERAIATCGQPTTIYRAAYQRASSTAFVASFARDVVEAASTGDAVAQIIVSDAVEHVERTIAAASEVISGTGPTRVAIVGGLTRIQLLLDALVYRLEQSGASVESIDSGRCWISNG